MIRAIIDEVVPADTVEVLRGGQLWVDAFPDEWRSLSDGEIITNAIGRRYDWLITCDKHMAFQQNLSGLALSVLVLPTSRLPEIERIQRHVQQELAQPKPGCFVVLAPDGHVSGRPAPHFVGSTKRTR